MRLAISIAILCAAVSGAVFLWLYAQKVVVVQEAAHTGAGDFIDDAVVGRMLTLRQSDEWADIEADLVTMDFSDFASDISEFKALFYEEVKE